jgi:hypothetical protein
LGNFSESGFGLGIADRNGISRICRMKGEIFLDLENSRRHGQNEPKNYIKALLIIPLGDRALGFGGLELVVAGIGMLEGCLGFKEGMERPSVFLGFVMKRMEFFGERDYGSFYERDQNNYSLEVHVVCVLEKSYCHLAEI